MTLEQLISSATFIALVMSGAWVYFRFFREDPLRPRIEFSIDCKFFGPQNDVFVAAFSIYAHNKGNVEHKFKKIEIKGFGIKASDPITLWKDHEPKLYFPTEVFREPNLVHPKFPYFFVRPKVNQSFSFVTKIPTEFRFLLVRATFEYEDTQGPQTADRVFEIPTSHDDIKKPVQSGSS